MARSPMPPPPTTPAMAEYDRKLTASTVSASTRPERASRSEEHTSELQSPCNLVCRLLLEKKNHTAHVLARATDFRARPPLPRDGQDPGTQPPRRPALPPGPLADRSPPRPPSCGLPCRSVS